MRDKSASLHLTPSTALHLYNENKKGKLNKQKCVLHFRKNFIGKTLIKIVLFCILFVRSESSLEKLILKAFYTHEVRT